MSIVDPLPGRSGEILQKGLSRLKKIDIRLLAEKKKSIALVISILALGSGLFFISENGNENPGFFSENKAYAKNRYDAPADIVREKIDPLSRIGKGVIGTNDFGSKSCVGDPFATAEEEKQPEKEVDLKLADMLSGSPMEEMVPALSTRSKDVAAYLVAIAKKESNWGKHTPKKNGQECYNYWGYRGKENTTNSGYSCFDSPEHAVEVVGNRIERLIDQNINTPAKMVVWKCGRDCEAAGGQAAANKWIADVASYYNKLNS